MKTIYSIFIVIILYGCGNPYPNEISEKSKMEIEFDNYKKSCDSTIVLLRYSLDSMKIINSFIDKLPKNIKSMDIIREKYMNNLDNSLAIRKKWMQLDNNVYYMRLNVLKNK